MASINVHNYREESLRFPDYPMSDYENCLDQLGLLGCRSTEPVNRPGAVCRRNVVNNEFDFNSAVL